jgi:hypothetical protein
VVFPRFGVWVLAKHSDGAPCHMGRPLAETTFVIDPDSVCEESIVQQDICSIGLSSCTQEMFSQSALAQWESQRAAQGFAGMKTRHWRRLVVDEFHLVEKRVQKLMHLYYEHCWFVTATPSMEILSLATTMHSFMGAKFAHTL